MRSPFFQLLFLFSVAAMFARAQQRELTQRDLEEMFYSDHIVMPKPAPRPAPPRVETQQRRTGIKYRVQLSRDGSSIRDVSPSDSFRANDKIRFQIETNTDGYLYVIQKGTSGQVSTLFPYEGMSDGANQVPRSTAYSVPADTWFAFDEMPGQEQVLVILSTTPLQSLPARAVRDTEHYRFPNIIAELNGRVQSRDLKWFSETTAKAQTSSPSLASVVVNTNPGKNDLVYAEISLKHN